MSVKSRVVGALSLPRPMWAVYRDTAKAELWAWPVVGFALSERIYEDDDPDNGEPDAVALEMDGDGSVAIMLDDKQRLAVVYAETETEAKWAHPLGAPCGG
jgi:hypothetical protein